MEPRQSIDRDRSEDNRRIPVIAITGYLGAGKTSLMNHLLRSPGARLGVVVNDFGTLNVDAALVVGQVDEAAAISGGCVCCLPDAGGLDEVLAKLSHPRLRLDAILIEASGLADPLTLGRLVRFSGAQWVRPGGIVEVIDAIEHFSTVDTWRDPPQRYAAATLVVIGKTDLLSVDERAAIVERIRERIRIRNAEAPIVIAEKGGIDPELVFDNASSEEAPDELPIAALLREEHHEHHEHASSASVPLMEPISPSALVDLLEEPPPGTYRLKGRVRVAGLKGEHGCVVNVVGRMIHVAPLATPPAVGELVAIGMELDPTIAHDRLERVASSSAVADAAGLRRLRRYRRLSD